MRIPPYADFNDQNLYQDDLNQEMQANLSDDGWVQPSQTTDNITSLAAGMPNGTFWYDTDTNEMKVLVNGVVKVVQVA